MPPRRSPRRAFRGVSSLRPRTRPARKTLVATSSRGAAAKRRPRRIVQGSRGIWNIRRGPPARGTSGCGSGWDTRSNSRHGDPEVGLVPVRSFLAFENSSADGWPRPGPSRPRRSAGRRNPQDGPGLRRGRVLLRAGDRAPPAPARPADGDARHPLHRSRAAAAAAPDRHLRLSEPGRARWHSARRQPIWRKAAADRSVPLAALPDAGPAGPAAFSPPTARSAEGIAAPA